METLGGAGASVARNSPEYLSEDSGSVLVAISISFAVLTTLFLGLRFYAKTFTAAPFGLDDGFIVAAYIVNLGMCAIGIATKVGGVGRHIEYIEEFEPQKQAGWAKSILAFEIVYFTSMSLPKIAIMFLYLRILNFSPAMRRMSYAIIAVLAATSIALIIAACFQCRPLAFWWDRTIAGGTCFDVQAFFHAQSIPGFIMDLVIIAIPLQTIWHLRLPTPKRIALVFIFVVGSFGIVASIVRATIFFGTAAFADRTRASVALVGWSIIETGTYIITGCLPATRPLFSRYTPQWIKIFVRKTFSNVASIGYSSTSKSKIISGSQSRHGKNHTGPEKSGWSGSRSTQKEDDEIELTGRPFYEQKGSYADIENAANVSRTDSTIVESNENKGEKNDQRHWGLERKGSRERRQEIENHPNEVNSEERPTMLDYVRSIGSRSTHAQGPRRNGPSAPPRRLDSRRLTIRESTAIVSGEPSRSDRGIVVTTDIVLQHSKEPMV